MILIAGAGPTGLTLAIDLARRGVEVRIVDKAERYFVGSRGKGLQPRSLEVFADLGVLDAIRAAGSPYPLSRMYGPDGNHIDRPMGDTSQGEPWMLCQSDLEGILRSKLAEYGVKVEFGCELTGFTQDEHGVTAVVNGTEVRADYLVGADGGHSFVRKHLGVAFVGHPVDQAKMVIADVTSRGLDPDRWHIWPKAKPTAIAMCPLPDGDDRFQFTLAITEEPEEITEDYLREALHERIGRTDVTLTDPTWTTIYRSNARMVDSYRVGRVFLAGDAAHVHPPTGGQGLNTGVQDAYNLSWKLAAVLNGASEALLDTYEEERLPIAAGVLGLSTDLLGKVLRNEEAGFQRGKETRQMHLNYRGQSLSRGEYGGDFVPGVYGPDFTLLSPQQCEPYGCKYVLVRPDGYIAISSDDLNEVRDYVQQLRLPVELPVAA